MTYDSVYVYGIVDGYVKDTICGDGVGSRGDEVYCVPQKDITAIVSDTPFQEYDPTEENTLAHERVIQAVMGKGWTIAPMRFCTVLKGMADLRKLMHSAYLPFKRNILKIRDRQEFDVKVFLDIGRLREDVESDDELVERSRKIAAELNEKLKQIADDAVLEEQITDEMILNASFLVHRKRVEAFCDEIKDFDKEFTDKLKIRISGPTAPYNFVNMPTK